MKKAIVCALAALALVAAAQPLEERAKALLERKRETTAAAPGVTFETQLGVKQESSLLDVTLYFRYGETNLLARSARSWICGARRRWRRASSRRCWPGRMRRTTG